MHLALVISALESGGAERVLSELANYWIKKGHKVSLVTLAPSDAKPFYPLDSRIDLIQINQRHKAISKITRLGNILRRVFYLRKVLKALRPDVIISFIDVMNITTLLASIGLNIPVIVSERTHPMYHHLSAFYRKIRKLLYLKAFRVVVQTDSSASYFKGIRNLAVIPNAVRRFTNKKKVIRTTVQRIVSVGRLCPFKGFDLLIQAFSQFHEEYPEMQLTIYGEGHERPKLEKLIRSLELQKKVFLPGVTPNIQKAILYTDLFIFPSHYEGFPNALCEAMAAGLPVIASNCSGNIDIIRDGFNGRLFSVGDVDALTRIVQELLNDQDQRKRLAQNAKAICDCFHPDIVFALWDKLIAEAFQG